MSIWIPAARVPALDRQRLSRREAKPLLEPEAFEELVRTLRNTEEWRYVDREIDIRQAQD